MYTWGQIRLLLQQFAPGVSLDTIDEKINARYSMLLGLQDWKGIEKKGWLETVAAVRTGTISIEEGSTGVIGSGTNWTGSVTNMQLLVDGSSKLYTVTFVDATHLTLDRPYEGISFDPFGYTLLQSIYSLPDDCRQLRVIANPYTGLALGEMTELEFAQKVGLPTLQGTADYFIPQPDTTDPGNGQTVQAIQLYPLPTLAQGYPLLYEQAAAGFDGVSTNAGPLAFVSDAAILAGARADLCRDKENYAGAESYEAIYKAHLQTIIHEDNDRRSSHEITMDPAYTRHRAARLLRQLGGTTLINGRW